MCSLPHDNFNAHVLNLHIDYIICNCINVQLCTSAYYNISLFAIFKKNKQCTDYTEYENIFIPIQAVIIIIHK